MGEKNKVGMALIRNNFYSGLVLGSLMPLIAYALTTWTDWDQYFTNRPAIFYVLAGLVNLFMMRWFYRNQGENTGRGVIFVTFLGVLLLIITRNISVNY
ncbi:MAG TPA: hypothetical protein VFD72_05125 [Sphingobacteriaceae bacterium]|nr:hypothetical protein [Sphingobacteriaceae bacterium]